MFVGGGDGNSVDCVGIREIEEGDTLMALGSRLDFTVGFKEGFLDVIVGGGDGNSVDFVGVRENIALGCTLEFSVGRSEGVLVDIVTGLIVGIVTWVGGGNALMHCSLDQIQFSLA